MRSLSTRHRKTPTEIEEKQYQDRLSLALERARQTIPADWDIILEDIAIKGKMPSISDLRSDSLIVRDACRREACIALYERYTKEIS